MEAKITNSKVQLRYAAIFAAVALVGQLILAIIVEELDNKGVPLMILMASAMTFILSFMVFRTWATLRHYPHQGWRRLFLIAGALGGILGFTVGYEMEYPKYSADLKDVLEVLTFGISGFVIAVTFTEGSRSLFNWVRDGFNN